MNEFIHSKIFTHKRGTGASISESRESCPFEIEAKCRADAYEMDCYHSLKNQIPEDCPMRSGSVTEIFFIGEDE